MRPKTTALGLVALVAAAAATLNSCENTTAPPPPEEEEEQDGLGAPAPADVQIGMQPFVGECVAGQPPPWCGYSLADVKTLLGSVKTAGFNTIRTFGSGPWNFDFQRGNAWNVQAASEVGGISVWNAAALFVGNDAISNQQITAAVEQAKAHPGVVKGIIVGVEPIGLQGLPVEKVVAFMNFAKQERTRLGFNAQTLPVTTSEQLGVLAGEPHRAVVEAAEQVIFANYYPVLACGVRIGTAITDPEWGLDAKFKGLREQIDSYGLTSLAIGIGETGWPSRGAVPHPQGCSKGVATASAANQRAYEQAVRDWAQTANVSTVFLFNSFNERWKGSCDLNSIDSNWGFLTTPSGLGITPPGGACQTPRNP